MRFQNIRAIVSQRHHVVHVTILGEVDLHPGTPRSLVDWVLRQFLQVLLRLLIRGTPNGPDDEPVQVKRAPRRRFWWWRRHPKQ